MLYTGLRRAIGSPKDYIKNKEEGTFPTYFDLAIPLNETTERGKNVEALFENQMFCTKIVCRTYY